MGQPIETIIHTKASQELQKEVEEDLKEPDPKETQTKHETRSPQNN